MKIREPLVAWLEDDDPYREQVCRQTHRALPDVPIHFSKTVSGFWRCLYDFAPRILVVDVMLPRIEGVTRLSEGLMLARWIRDGSMPEEAARYLRVPEETRHLGGVYVDVPIYFVTGRSREKLETEIAELGLTGSQVIEKGIPEGESAADQAIAAIRRELVGTRRE